MPKLAGLDVLRLDVDEGRLPAFPLSSDVSIILCDGNDTYDEPWATSLPPPIIIAGT